MPRKPVFNLDIQLNPVQSQFVQSRGTADLFSSRVGEGKSVALVMACFVHTLKNPGARWLMLRDTWENLRKTTQKTFFEWFPPGLAGEYHATNFEFTWAPGIAEGTVIFMGAGDAADASKLASLELAGIAMDEPAPSSTSGGIHEEIFDMALGRLRQKAVLENDGWYAMKLAENNPDESHWTYKKFYEDPLPGYRLFQPPMAENTQNLPADYYEKLRRNYERSGRPDLIRRFIDGKAGFQMLGRPVTPNWNDELHLATGLGPRAGAGVGDLILLWDFGLNPTCIVTQLQNGYWMILDALVGSEMGLDDLIRGHLIPLLNTRYRGQKYIHVGDPAGNAREQNFGTRAVDIIRQALRGKWYNGIEHIEPRVEALNQVLARQHKGLGFVQVDRHRAKEVHHALRGGWHYKEIRGGAMSMSPNKNIHSHPGDAMSYGAGYIARKTRNRMQHDNRIERITKPEEQEASYFFKPGSAPPKHGAQLRTGGLGPSYWADQR